MASLGEVAAQISQSVSTEESAIRAGGETVPVLDNGAGMLGAAILNLEEAMGNLVASKPYFEDAAVRSFTAAETADTATEELSAALQGSDVEGGATAIAAYESNKAALTDMGNTARSFEEAINEVRAIGETFKEKLTELSQRAEGAARTANEEVSKMPEATRLAIEVAGRLIG